jgi:protein-S-isoprenylcysteine O-methyltransferase Ste14
MLGGKLLYGALFILVLPALLVLWASAAEPNVGLAPYGGPLLGSVFAGCGLILMGHAMLELWRVAHGLPMNPYPPERLVSTGPFRWIPHPIYTGFVTVCFGVSMMFGSAAGLWLVTPVTALACAALVIGYERHDLRERFGRTLHVLPADEDTPPTTRERILFWVSAVMPWLGLYGFTVSMGLIGTAFKFPFENNLPIWSWTSVVYQTSYITVALAPWSARTRRELRQLTITAWVASAVIFPFYWIVPSAAPRRPMTADNPAADLLAWERNTYPPTAAFPSFHVLWAIFVARLYRPRWLGYAYIAAIAISCITTGMHYIPDILASFAIAPLLLHPERVWRWMRRMSERLANSWREWRIGPVRVINHGFYAGLAGTLQVLIVTAVAGNPWKVLATGVAGLVWAGAWAQWVEGSSRLRRPFGFYGGFLGVAVACLFFDERWMLLAGHCLGAPWMQAIGRLRCFVNGCCHGGPASDRTGIRVTEPHSRVTRLASLAGQPIHATQLYSILANILLGGLLIRFWLSGASLALICGAYAMGNGLARFVEEAYRGEPQTPVLYGLRLYQWIAIAMLVSGAVLTTLPSPLSTSLRAFTDGVVAALVFGVLSFAAMGVDFPESNRPLGSLT